MSQDRIRQSEEMKMKEGEFKEAEKKFREQAKAWVEMRFPERMSSVGVDEKEVRRQLEHEADRWVRYNLEATREGKKLLESPDATVGKLSDKGKVVGAPSHSIK